MRPDQKMPFTEAMDLVDPEMPDGAFWALAHEIAGLEYGDGFDDLLEAETGTSRPPKPAKHIRCQACGKRFGSEYALGMHAAAKHSIRPEGHPSP